ncbi:MAG: hypothetical protein EXR49_04960 [Dehalococcoidia bacterium]|nr:hypothetical protein [Dehalococcoidia bacterium]
MSDRIEREIDEIVQQAGGLPSRTPLRQLFRDALRRFRQGLGTEWGRAFRRLSPKTMGAVAVLLLVSGLIIKSPLLTFAALGLMMAAYLVHVVRGMPSFQETTGFERSWRGKPLDKKPRKPRRWPFGKNRKS